MTLDRKVGEATLPETLKAALNNLQFDCQMEIARYRTPSSPTHEPFASVSATESPSFKGVLLVTQTQSEEAEAPVRTSTDSFVDLQASLVHQPAAQSAIKLTDQSRESYLASSAELLRSLQMSSTSAPKQKPKQKGLSSTLLLAGAGLMALVATVVGFEFFVRRSVTPVRIADNTSLPIEAPSESTETVTSELETPETSTGSGLVDTLLPSSADSPTTTSAVDPPAPVQITLSRDYFYVLAPYEDGESFRQAQIIVGDAFLAKFPQGVRIQMGVFETQFDAETFVQRLAGEGLGSEVYRPQ
ncbi:MAG: hypothetical protein AAGG02_07065 [Cyanobacteria bacterium P01_H01_bin.15]